MKSRRSNRKSTQSRGIVPTVQDVLDQDRLEGSKSRTGLRGTRLVLMGPTGPKTRKRVRQGRRVVTGEGRGEGSRT